MVFAAVFIWCCFFSFFGAADECCEIELKTWPFKVTLPIYHIRPQASHRLDATRIITYVREEERESETKKLKNLHKNLITNNSFFIRQIFVIFFLFATVAFKLHVRLNNIVGDIFYGFREHSHNGYGFEELFFAPSSIASAFVCMQLVLKESGIIIYWIISVKCASPKMKMNRNEKIRVGGVQCACALAPNDFLYSSTQSYR